jgi:hypothetical protein
VLEDLDVAGPVEPRRLLEVRWHRLQAREVQHQLHPELGPHDDAREDHEDSYDEPE